MHEMTPRPPFPRPGGARTVFHVFHHIDDVRKSTISRDALAIARTLPSDELAALADALRAEAAYWETLSDLDNDSRQIAAILVGDRLSAVEAELARRERLAAAGVCRSPSRDRDYAAWRELAREIRERIDCHELLARELGWRPARQSRKEAHGPCPLCGGTDRFVVHSRGFWCRQCGWRGDVITLTRALWQGTSFRDTLRRLAGEVAP